METFGEMLRRLDPDCYDESEREMSTREKNLQMIKEMGERDKRAKNNPSPEGLSVERPKVGPRRRRIM